MTVYKLDEGRTAKNLGISEDATVEDIIKLCRG